MGSGSLDVTQKESVLDSAKPSKAIVKLAVPATLALLAKAVYNIVDTAYIGLLDSDTALAAVGVTLPLLLIFVSIPCKVSEKSKNKRPNDILFIF